MDNELIVGSADDAANVSYNAYKSNKAIAAMHICCGDTVEIREGFAYVLEAVEPLAELQIDDEAKAAALAAYSRRIECATPNTPKPYITNADGMVRYLREKKCIEVVGLLERPFDSIEVFYPDGTSGRIPRLQYLIDLLTQCLNEA